MQVNKVVKNNITPVIYSVMHVHRYRLRAHPYGGGFALARRNFVFVEPHQLASMLTSHPSFKLQLIKITSTTPSITVANLLTTANFTGQFQ